MLLEVAPALHLYIYIMDLLGPRLPYDALQYVLNCLLLHPAPWNRKKHFGQCEGGLGDSPCACCVSSHLHYNLAEAAESETGCEICYQAWVLTTLCKIMMRNVQMHNATCNCLTCAKSWMDKGWCCPRNPWYKFTMPWMERSFQAHLAGLGRFENPMDLMMALDYAEHEEDGGLVAARVLATYSIPACMHGCVGRVVRLIGI